MASNIQAGTRGLSAGDWIRLKRLQGSRNYQADKDGDVTNSLLRLEPESGRRVFTEFGTSKVRRPASSWTDYRASQTADYVLERQDSETKSRNLDINKVCGCVNDSIYTIILDDFDATHAWASNSRFEGIPISIGSIVYFTNLSSEGTIVQNNIHFYIVNIGDGSSPGDTFIEISQTLNGTPINFNDDGSNPVSPGILNIITPGVTSSAIKHNPTCIKCIHS